MPSRSVCAFALLTGFALATAGCGPQAASSSAGGAPASTESASPSAAGTCAAGAEPPPSGSTLTLGSRDNRTTFCLRVGQQVLVYLNGSPAHMWAPIHSDSSALQSVPNGRMMLKRGVTGAAFAAAGPGIVHITSSRAVCTGKPVRCDAMIAFQVTLVIAGAAQ